MTEFDSPLYGPASLSQAQREVLDRFLAEGEHAVFVGPTGTGKGRTAAEVATAIAVRPGRVLIVASSPVGRQMAASARHVGVPTLELSRAKLRQLTDDHWRPPEASVVHVSPLMLSDPWSADLLAQIGWDLIIVDEPSAVFEFPAAFVRQSGSRVLAITSRPDHDPAVWSERVRVYRFDSPFLIEPDQPAPELAERFRPLWFERHDHELAIAEMVDELIASAGVAGARLGLHRLATASASSSYALQVATLRQLDRLRDARNVIAHIGRAGHREDAALTLALENEALLVELYARLEQIASAVDELEFDTKRDLFMEFAMNREATSGGGTVIFCSVAATADYVASGLEFMRQHVHRLGVRSDPDRLLWAAAQPHHFLVAHDPILKGLDLRTARQAVNYDLVASQRRMHVRWSKLDLSEPHEIRVWSLLPRRPASSLERLAVERMPYLVGSAS